jgi:hypothetical protein
MARVISLFLVVVAFLLTAEVRAHDPPKATLYRNAGCGCCLEYARYLRRNGFDVEVSNRSMTPIREQHEVPDELEGCHTMAIGDYAIEGHVPVAVINRLLSEKPKIRGISLPGMPAGSPGMTGTKNGPFVIYEITDGPRKIYATE